MTRAEWINILRVRSLLKNQLVPFWNILPMTE